jgi:hypothetical protein
VNNGQKTFLIAYYPFRYLSKSIDCRLLSASTLPQYQLNYFHLPVGSAPDCFGHDKHCTTIKFKITGFNGI